MAEAVQPARLRAGEVAFTLERFERTDDGRLEIDGRWSGVRGRRFIRPSLIVGHDGERQRLLAELDHKPWAAEDGEPWRAAFRVADVDVNELEDPELAVAPDISLTLPAPGARRRRTTRRPPTASTTRRAETDRLRDERDRVRAELNAARSELEAARAELDTAHAERSGALAVRDAALSQRAEARAEREAALAAASKAHAARSQAIAERDAAVVRLHVITAERDAAVAELGAAVRDRTAAQFELEDLREAARQPPGPREPVWATGPAQAAASVPPPVSPFLAAGRRNVGWPLRAMAVGGFIVILLVLAVMLHVL